MKLQPVLSTALAAIFLYTSATAISRGQLADFAPDDYLPYGTAVVLGTSAVAQLFAAQSLHLRGYDIFAALSSGVAVAVIIFAILISGLKPDSQIPQVFVAIIAVRIGIPLIAGISFAVLAWAMGKNRPNSNVPSASTLLR